MKYELHCHTIYSHHAFWGTDAVNRPEDMIKAAVKLGLSGMAITDHDTIRGSIIGKKFAKHYKKDFKVITGSEVMTRDGEVLCLGIDEEVRPMMSVEDTIQRVHDLGGVAVAPHPFAEYLLGKVLKEKAVLTDAVEVYNSLHFNFYNKKAQRFSEKHKMPKTAGSDAHYWKDVGNAVIVCDMDPLEAILKGKVKILGKRMPVSHLAYVSYMKLNRIFNWRILNKRPKL